MKALIWLDFGVTVKPVWFSLPLASLEMLEVARVGEC